jgi:CheY-like chemotaxis protein
MKTNKKAAYAGARKTVGALKVLVVDDDPFQLEFIAEVLRSLGVLDITLAASSELALQAQNRYRDGAPFDLLLCDLHMPGMDGFQLMEAISGAGYKGALIIVSGQGSTVMRSASLVAQLRRFRLLGSLEKPLDKSALSALLSTLTG